MLEKLMRSFEIAGYTRVLRESYGFLNKEQVETIQAKLAELRSR